MALLSGDRPGAATGRMLLPVVVIGPVLLALLFEAGRRAGLYGPEFRAGADHAGHHGAAGDEPAVECRAGGSPASRSTGRGGSAAAKRATIPQPRRGPAGPDLPFLPDTTLTFVNRAYADFYGREPEELIGKRWLDFAPKDERPRFLEELTSFTPEHPERHEETRSTRVDHEVRWYLCHLYGFFDEAGKIVSFRRSAPTSPPASASRSSSPNSSACSPR